MARSISAASLAKLATKKGTEPVCLVEVEWVPGQPTILYGDRAFPDHPEIDGRIQSITNVADILNFSKNGTAQSVTVVLLDTDALVKTIFNNTDIHRKKVWVWQWFDGIPLSDKFLLFQGVIATPITWKEAERTLLFDVVSKLDDFEVGFSAEEGFFPNLPDALIGKPWPIVFGTVSKVQALLLDDIPHGGGGRRRGSAADSILKDALGIRDPALEPFINDATLSFEYQMQLAAAYFIAYLEASFTARKHGELGDFDPIDSGTGTFSGLARQYLDAGNAALKIANGIQAKVLKLKATRDKQKAFEKKQVGVTNGDAFPQGEIVAINIGGAVHTGYFSGDNFFIVDAQHPLGDLYAGINIEDPSTRVGEPVITRDNFFFADAGTPIRIGIQPTTGAIGPIFGEIRYIVCSSVQAQVVAVYAWQTDQSGLRFLNPVPPQYYEVLQLMYGTLPVTALLLPQPLSTLLDANGFNLGYADELWCTVVSDVGPNTVDIMTFLINTYTDYTIDTASFAIVQAAVEPYPMNFAVLNRPNAIKLLQDIAYQARCMLYAKAQVFFLKYLSIADTPVDTITEADIIYQSLQIETTQTEDLITKYIAEWQPDYIYDQAGELAVSSAKFKVILRFNTQPYGVHAQTFDYFCFNQQTLVEKSATFWMIRESSIYKRVLCKVPISKLNIEVMDTVTLDFSHPYIANGPVIGLVEEATFNPDDYTVSLNMWVPVRLGEMIQYDFAYPGDLSEIDFWPTIADQNLGRTLPSSALNNNVTQPDGQKPFSGDPGNFGSITYGKRKKTLGDPNPSDDNPNTQPGPISTRIDSSTINALGQKPPGTTQYQFDKTKVTPVTIIPPTNGTFPGKIIAKNGEDDSYSVLVFMQGLSGSPTTINAVFQVDEDTDNVFDEGVAVMVTHNVWKDTKGNFQDEWTMQGTVWQ